MKELILEVNPNQVKDDGIIAGGAVMITPSVGNEDYWVLRVKLSKTQSIIAFPKFFTIGIGFSKETDWNTNLPYDCKTEEIFNHIKCNKGSKTIKDDDCRMAILMIQQYINEYDLEKKIYD